MNIREFQLKLCLLLQKHTFLSRLSRSLLSSPVSWIYRNLLSLWCPLERQKCFESSGLCAEPSDCGCAPTPLQSVVKWMIQLCSYFDMIVWCRCSQKDQRRVSTYPRLWGNIKLKVALMYWNGPGIRIKWWNRDGRLWQQFIHSHTSSFICRPVLHAPRNFHVFSVLKWTDIIYVATRLP